MWLLIPAALLALVTAARIRREKIDEKVSKAFDLDL